MKASTAHAPLTSRASFTPGASFTPHGDPPRRPGAATTSSARSHISLPLGPGTSLRVVPTRSIQTRSGPLTDQHPGVHCRHAAQAVVEGGSPSVLLDEARSAVLSAPRMNAAVSAHARCPSGRQTAVRALSAAWAAVEPTAVWTSPPAAAPTAYQKRSGGLKVEPSTRRMTALRWASSPVTSLSCKNSTPQLTASALPAAVRGVTRGATRTTRVRSRTVYSASPPYLAGLPAATARSPSPAPTVTTAAAAAARRIRAGSTARASVPGTKGIGAYCRTSGARGGAHRTPDRRIRTSPAGSVRGQVVARPLVRAASSRKSVISPPLRSTSE